MTHSLTQYVDFHQLPAVVPSFRKDSSHHQPFFLQ